MQMGPMIDMVFLLLVFFMVTAKPIKQESDLGLGLPGAVSQEESVDIPDEQRIVITENGQIVLNDLSLDTPDSRDLPELLATLKRFKEAADRNKGKALVTLAPEDATKHQRVVDVLSVCALADLTNVTFAGAGENGGEVEP
jgi:biopolymer transport protein ExbD